LSFAPAGAGGWTKAVRGALDAAQTVGELIDVSKSALRLALGEGDLDDLVTLGIGAAGLGAGGLPPGKPNINPPSEASNAKELADLMKASGRKKGVASELKVGDNMFLDVSTGADRDLHPDLTEALSNVPPAERAPWHGHCAEIGCLNQALNKGINPRGGTSSAVNIGRSGDGHGTPRKACKSCHNVLNQFGVDHD